LPALPRVQTVMLPILNAYPAIANRVPAVKCGTWIPEIDYRDFPLIHLRRVGGSRNRNHPTKLSLSVIEMTAFGAVSLPDTENLYEDALEALYDAVERQVVVPDVGHLSSIKETMGATQFGSPFQDSWRVQGLIQLGVRPPRPTS